MKKILTVLLASAMMFVAPAGVFADELQELEENPTEGTIQLVASKTSSYTVKLPKVLDVSDDSTTFDIQAKGDVDGAMKVVVEKATGDHLLADNSGKNEAKVLTITNGNGIAGSVIEENYAEAAKDSMTIVHDSISAGDWSYELPIVIRLAAIA